MSFSRYECFGFGEAVGQETSENVWIKNVLWNNCSFKSNPNISTFSNFLLCLFFNILFWFQEIRFVLWNMSFFNARTLQQAHESQKMHTQFFSKQLKFKNAQTF